MSIKLLKIEHKYDRVFSVADIHGENQSLEHLIGYLENSLQFNQKGNDLLIFLGDYCDRGPDSRKVFDTLHSLRNKYGEENVICIAGNHEHLMLEALEKKALYENWVNYNNGGSDTLLSYLDHILSDYNLRLLHSEKTLQVIEGNKNSPLKILPEIKEVLLSSSDFNRHLDFIRDMPLAVELNNKFFFSHAPLNRDKKRTSPDRHPRYGELFCSKRGEQYTRKDLTWTYFGIESEGEGGFFEKHEGVMSDFGVGSKKLKAHCGHIHRLSSGINEVRLFKNYSLLDSGSGCGPDGKLALYDVLTREVTYFNNKGKV